MLRMNPNVVMADRKQETYRLLQDKSDEKRKEVFKATPHIQRDLIKCSI